jgi:hypothetical protein
MTTFTGTVSTDGYMRDDNTTYVGGTSTPTSISVGESNAAASVRRGLIKADLSSIPTTATITSATLSLTVVTDLSSNARDMYAYRIKRNWDNNYACWNNYGNGSAWASAGCSNTSTDREATAVGTVNVAASPAVGSVIDMPLSVSAVQEWTSGGTANYGVLLQVATESSDLINYNSNENGDSALNPKWTINYTDGSDGAGYILILNTT